MAKQVIPQSKNYANILRQIVAEIKHTRVVIANRVNTSLIQMYWNIGKHLSQEGLEKGYGSAVVKRLSVDLKAEFPDSNGFSPRNLWYMKLLYEFYSGLPQKAQQAVALLPWGHHILILSKIDDREEALFYMESAIKQTWSRNILLHFIKADSYRNAKLLPKANNFKRALPENLQEQANDILKSSYSLDLLGITKPLKELDLEKSLVAIDLKIGEFEPEYVGKMNYYLGLLDDKIKMKDENPSIGLILCASKNNVDVEIALRDVNKPILFLSDNSEKNTKSSKLNPNLSKPDRSRFL
jgi:predicted nuclease of restriction endonuclease-like (RecB) superfamily